MPEKGETLKFKNYHHQYNHPFHIISDFESTLQKIETEKGNSILYEKHLVNSYGLKYNCDEEQYSENIKIYNCDNPELVVKNFILDIEKLAEKSYKIVNTNVKL